MKNLKTLSLTTLLLALLFMASPGHAQQTTAFTYQGQLRDGGTNANGTYGLTFKLFDAVTSGNQLGGTLTSSALLANGLFSVNLDFGSAFDGGGRWLDITVQSGVSPAETLAPRVQVLSAPYALYATKAGTVTNGAIMNAQLAANAIATANIQNNAITTAQIANGAVTNRNLTANAVNATNIASSQVVKSLNGLTDSVTLAAGANVALFINGNTLQLSAVVPNIQAFDGNFTTGGTFVVPTNVTRIMVEVWGAGGGGGNGFKNSNATNSGGGGGAGGYGLGVFTVTPGSSFTVTVGSGGNAGQSGGASSFGALISANGGAEGAAGGVASGISGTGGAGGTSSGGLVSARGIGGSPGDSFLPGLGGLGGSVWRGAVRTLGNNGASGPAAGGIGGSAGTSGIPTSGNGGAVIITY